MMEPQDHNQGQEDNADRDLVFAHQSSEPESNSRGQTPAETRHQDELPRGQQRAAGKNVPHPHDQHQENAPLLARPSEDLYNFKGFMLFCFGAPRISPVWCSCFLFFYYALLFTVGICIIVIGCIALADLDLTGGKFGKQYLYADILSILSGLLFMLAAFYGGCVWTHRTTILPVLCARSFLPLSIIALLLSFAHVSLTSALASVMILYGNEIIHPDQTNFDFRFSMFPLWTLSSLVLWGCCFTLALIPTLLLFWRKYKPPNNA